MAGLAPQKTRRAPKPHHPCPNRTAVFTPGPPIHFHLWAPNATLNGTVNPNGAATTAYFRYGLTTNYGSFSATNSLAATNTTQSVSNLIASLTPGTAYHFQLVATNSAGSASGADLTFTTSRPPPTVTTSPTAVTTATNTTIEGTINPNAISTPQC